MPQDTDQFQMSLLDLCLQLLFYRRDTGSTYNRVFSFFDCEQAFLNGFMKGYGCFGSASDILLVISFFYQYIG